MPADGERGAPPRSGGDETPRAVPRWILGTGGCRREPRAASRTRRSATASPPASSPAPRQHAGWIATTGAVYARLEGPFISWANSSGGGGGKRCGCRGLGGGGGGRK